METPLGRFYVQAAFRPDDSFLGSFAFETSAYSRLTDWPGGGDRGHPRNERAVPPRPGGLTRLRPDVEYRSARPEALRATRHADRDHPLKLTSCLLDCAPGAVIATNAASERRTTQ